MSSALLFQWILIHYNEKAEPSRTQFYISTFNIIIYTSYIRIRYKTICSSFNMNTFYSYETMLCWNNSQSQFSLVLSATIKQSKPNTTWCVLYTYPLRSRHPLILSWFWMYNVICITSEHTKWIQIFMCFLQINHYHYRVKRANFIKRTTFWTF